MNRVVVFLVLVAGPLWTVAQSRVRLRASELFVQVEKGQAALIVNSEIAGRARSRTDMELFATGCMALTSLLFVWSPLGAVRRRRVGSRAQISALILAILLCSIMAIQGCGGTASGL